MVQLVISKDKQLVTALVPTIIHVTTSLPTYVPRCSDDQPSDGRQPRDPHKGN